MISSVGMRRTGCWSSGPDFPQKGARKEKGAELVEEAKGTTDTGSLEHRPRVWLDPKLMASRRVVGDMGKVSRTSAEDSGGDPTTSKAYLGG